MYILKKQPGSSKPILQFEHLSLDKGQMNNPHRQEEGDNPPANPHSARRQVG